LEQQEQQATYLSVEKWNKLFDEEKERIERLKGNYINPNSKNNNT